MCSTRCSLRLADTIEKQVELRRKVKSAMTYPIVVLVICSVIATAMLLLIVPQFKAIYADLGGTLPLPTRILISISDLLKTFFPIFVLLGVGALLRCSGSGQDRQQGKPKWDAFKLRVPVGRRADPQGRAGPLLAHARGADPLRRRASSRRSTSSPRPPATRSSSTAVRDTQGAVKRGDTLARPLEQHEVFPPMVVQMISVGEETGALDEMLDKIADFYDQEVSRDRRRARRRSSSRC